MEIIQIFLILGVITVVILRYISKAFGSSNVKTAQPIKKNVQTVHKEKSPFINNEINKSKSLNDYQLEKSTENTEVERNNISRSVKNISLENVKEARKAFIYSEIFNKKY